MARPDNGMVRQFHQTTDGFAQRGTVTAGQIGAAAITDKQGVARKEVSLRMQADASWGMSGRMNHIKR